MLKDDYFANQRTFLTTYAARMPGSGNDGGAIPGRRAAPCRASHYGEERALREPAISGVNVR